MKFKINFINGREPIEVEGENFAAAVSNAVKQGVSLGGADLRHADLRHTDLSHSDLTCADLNHAALCKTDLNQAYFDQTTLEGADMDYSCLPLWCGSLNANVDKRLAVQLLYHACRWLKSVDDVECRNFLQIPEVKKLANQFHRVSECGEI